MNSKHPAIQGKYMEDDTHFDLSESVHNGDSPFVFSESERTQLEMSEQTTMMTCMSPGSPISPIITSPVQDDTIVFDFSDTALLTTPTRTNFTLSQIESFKQSSSETRHPSILSPDIQIETNNTFIISAPDEEEPQFPICSPITSPNLLSKLVPVYRDYSHREDDIISEVVSKSLINGISFIKLKIDDEEFVALFPERSVQTIEVGMMVTMDKPYKTQNIDDITYMLGCTRIDEINLG